MKIKVSHIVDHRSSTFIYLPQENQQRQVMVMPGAGCTIGCCCTSCGAVTRK